MVFSAGGSGVDLGSAFARIRIDLNQLQTDMRSAQGIFSRGLQSIGPSLQSFGQNISQLGQNLTLVTAPLTAFAATGIRAAADFELLMKQIQVFGGVAPEQLARVSAFALDMGAQTKFSASDAATALLDLLKSGQSLEEGMSSLRSILDLAAAGELSLASASSIVTSALAQFSLGADQAGRVGTALVQAANASRAEVSDLGAALQNVGPIASQFGLSVEDTAAILAVFSQRGIDGAEAGTQLRSMLLNMSEATETTQAAWNELGISLYDANGNARDFNTVLVELDRALDGLPIEKQNELMRALGGAYGILGLTALRSAGGIDDMRRAMGESADASEVAQAFTDSFQGALESLRGSLETLQISALTPLIQNSLTPFVKQLTEIINRVTEWVTANPELAQSITKVLAGVVALGPALIGIGKVISTIGLFLKPGGLIIGGLTLLYSAFETNFLGIRDLLGPIVETIGAGLSAIGEAIQFFILDIQEFGLGEAILDLFGRGTLGPEMGQGLFSGILQAFGMTSEAANAFVDSLFDTFTRIGNFIQNQVLPPLQAFADWFTQTALPAVVNFVTGTVVPAVQGFFEWLGGVWERLSPSLGRLFNWLTNEILPMLVAFVQDSVIPTVGRFVGILEGIWRAVSPVLGSLANWFLEEGLPGVLTFLEGDFTRIFGEALTTIKNIWDGASETLGTLVTWFTEEGLPAVLDFLEGDFSRVFGEALTTIKNIWDGAKETLNTLVNWFTEEGLPAILDFIETTVKPGIQGLENLFNNIWTNIQSGVNALRDGINGALGWIDQNVIKPIRDGIYELQRIIAEITGQPPPPPPMPTAAPSPVNRQVLIDVGVLPGGNTVRRAGVSGWRDGGGLGRAGELYLMSARAGQEAFFVPPADGNFYPNFDKTLADLAAGAGDTITVHIDNFNASGKQEAREAADAFADRLMERFRNRS